MAATVSAWSKPGAWALDAEENEAELIHQQKEDLLSNTRKSNAVVSAPEADFPSLSAAITTKTKKKKPQTISLQEFTAAESKSYTSPAARGLTTTEEILSLPTGPRERTAEELDRTRLGGGFRSFDTRSSRGDENRRQGGFNREPREIAPSRADETDNWGAAKKSSGGNGFERRERGERGGFFSDSQSRADEVDNWASNKSFVPSEGRRYERRGSGFESNGGAADSDNWVKKKEDAPKFGGSFDSLRSRRGGNENSPDSDTWGRKRDEGSNGGVGVVGGARPRLTLQPRTLPVPEVQVQQDEVKPKGPPEVLQIEVKPKGLNPFGAARPREEVLKEKGQDWKEIDEKLEAVKIKEVAKAVDGPAFSKRGFGNGPEDRTERAWRKPESVDAPPASSENGENGHAEETQTQEGEAETEA